MPLKILQLEDLDDLFDVLRGLDGEKPDRMVSMEEAEDRFQRGCRLAYNVSRNALDSDEHIAHAMLATASERMHTGHGTNAVCAALLLQSFAFYIEVDQKADMEGFKKKFILCLDKSVKELGKGMRETHDTWTEQSAEERSSQSPATP